MEREARRSGIISGPGTSNTSCREHLLARSNGPKGLDFRRVNVSLIDIKARICNISGRSYLQSPTKTKTMEMSLDKCKSVT